MAIFNSIFIPISLSFLDMAEALGNSPVYVFFDFGANIFFMIDIIL